MTIDVEDGIFTQYNNKHSDSSINLKALLVDEYPSNIVNFTTSAGKDSGDDTSNRNMNIEEIAGNMTLTDHNDAWGIFPYTQQTLHFQFKSTTLQARVNPDKALGNGGLILQGAVKTAGPS
uniref:Uncharacterized protein n=1 Tax=Glossina palpalis gambiensis TaxID=67801 RepID=A0A1B0BJE9_9MUSC